MFTRLSFIQRFFLFFIINFGALALGSWLQGDGAFEGWYASLNKAPWTPPGWVFAAAWFSIMLCFTFLMAILPKKNAIVWLFWIQFVLNVSWNPVFFALHEVLAAFVMISALLIVVTLIGILSFQSIKAKALLILPYIIWLLIATSLNGYILFKN